MRVRKKAGIVLEAFELMCGGSIETARGEILKFSPGDYMLTSTNGDQWPVSKEYFDENYEDSEY
jgi:hypothetical protein